MRSRGGLGDALAWRISLRMWRIWGDGESIRLVFDLVLVVGVSLVSTSFVELNRWWNPCRKEPSPS